jgi:hypothetical protein
MVGPLPRTTSVVTKANAVTMKVAVHRCGRLKSAARGGVARGPEPIGDGRPWFEWGLKVPAGAPLAQQHPELLSTDGTGQRTFDQDGTTTAYLNFVYPDVQRFYEELLVEFVTRYDVPAIQFDDHFSLKKTLAYRNYVQDWSAWVEAGPGWRSGVMAGQKPATVPVGMVHDQTAMAREHGCGVVYFVQESLLRFTAPREIVESRFEALRLLSPGASTRR